MKIADVKVNMSVLLSDEGFTGCSRCIWLRSAASQTAVASFCLQVSLNENFIKVLAFKCEISV